MNLHDITPLILTWNEEPNLRRCLERLRWAKEVVILDSGSTDATAAIAAEFPNTRLLVRPFDDHTTQWNHGVDACGTNWILSLDCDYVLCPGFEEELSKLEEATAFDAFYASFRYLIFGKPLRACLYPPRAVLFRKDRCRYIADGHTQVLSIPGIVAHLVTKIDHDDRKPLSRWFSSQDKYALLEAEKLAARTRLSPQDRIRRFIVIAPWLVFFFTLIVRGTLLDGWRGWFYAFQRMAAEIMLSLRLLERRFVTSGGHSS
ncbi:MAG: glycosyltransferase family 2 protein [Verrucomicrobiaceae bacterium]|nr:glycosyltransferase family 2 protein [Verrucomicrobiaceae bacterium]